MKSRMMGMPVRSGRGGYGSNGITPTRQQNRLLTIVRRVDDEGYGTGLLGRDIVNGKLYLVFQDPVPSESRAKSKMAKSVGDYAKGANIAGNVFTMGPGSILEVSRLVLRNNVPARSFKTEAGEEKADVIFCQWPRMWKSSEQIEKGTDKTVIFCYAIARERTNDMGDTVVKLSCFSPKGPNNLFSPEYPVVFRVNNLAELVAHIDRESEQLQSPFDDYVVRVVDNKNGMIVGAGEIVSCNNWNAPNKKRSEIFIQNLAMRLGSLTRESLEKFIGNPDYSLEIYGLFPVHPGRIGADEGKLSLSEEISRNQHLVPRDGESGAQAAMIAAPVGLRGKTLDNGSFWADRIVILGKIGFKPETGAYEDDSDLIAADGYSGTPLDENGNIAERGLGREAVSFDMGDSVKEVVSMRDLAECMGLERVNYPDQTFDREYFVANWEGAPKPEAKPRPAGPGGFLRQANQTPRPQVAQGSESGDPFDTDEVPF